MPSPEDIYLNEQSESDIFIFPNPTTGDLYFSGENIELVKLFDISGREIICDINLQSNHIRLDDRFDVGVYFLIFKSSEKLTTKKFILNR